jgi:hypothetical protein
VKKFKLPLKDGTLQYFRKAFEIMKKHISGYPRHDWNRGDSVERAVAYFATKGIGIKADTAKVVGG